MDQPMSEKLPSGDAKDLHARRDAQLDNCKFLLIFLMVLGHTFEQFRSEIHSDFYSFQLYLCISHGSVCFPCGIPFQRYDKCRETAVERFFLPYELFNLLTYLWIALINGTKLSVTGFQLFFSSLYNVVFVALFVWKMMFKRLCADPPDFTAQHIAWGWYRHVFFSGHS